MRFNKRFRFMNTLLCLFILLSACSIKDNKNPESDMTKEIHEVHESLIKMDRTIKNNEIYMIDKYYFKVILKNKNSSNEECQYILYETDKGDGVLVVLYTYMDYSDETHVVQRWKKERAMLSPETFRDLVVQINSLNKFSNEDDKIHEEGVYVIMPTILNSPKFESASFDYGYAEDKSYEEVVKKMIAASPIEIIAVKEEGEEEKIEFLDELRIK